MKKLQVTMPFVLCLIVALILGDVQGQQCPHNDIQGITSDGSRAVPLTSPLCFRCLYLVGGNVVTPTDITWSRGPSPFITLTNGSMNGNVLIDPNTDILILPNPIDVINVGNTLRCNSASQGQHEITITQFIFRNPILSPDGGSDMIADVTEGTDLTLSCNDPGNTGTTRYQWFDNNGSSLTDFSTNPPLVLPFPNIQRNSSGFYICQSTKTIVPGVIKMSNVTINVQYPAAITSISLASVSLPRDSEITINCTFEGNPAPENITWQQNGTVLNPDNFTHISVDTQTTYTELALTLQGLEDSGSYVCVTENIIGIERSSKVNITVQVAPSPVASLIPQLIGTSSVKLTWSYGFNGNADIIGVNITYEAVNNSNTSDSVKIGPVSETEITISDLQPHTTYNFIVIVINNVSDIVGTSIPVSVTIETVPLVPNAPTLNTVTAINSTALRISWTDNRDPFTQTKVQSYTVTYVPVDQSQSMLSVIVLAPNTTVDIGDLMKGTYYNVTIYANNSVGRSPDSNSVTTRTDIDPPLSINMLNITSYPDSLCVSWQPPLENGGQDISSYQVYVRNDNATPTEDYMLHGNLGPSNLTYIVEPLMNSNRYSVSVAASNIDGGQSPNTTISKTTDAPLIPSVSNIIALQATVRWIPSSENLDQHLQYQLQGQDWSNTTEKIFNSSVSQYIYTDLIPETVYEIRLIRIGNDNCPQLISPTVNFTTLELKVVVTSSINGPVTAGNSVVLVCNLDTGGAPSTVTWTRDNGVLIPLDVISGNVLNITNPQVEDTANYTCSFRDVSYTFSLVVVNPVPTSSPSATASTGLPVYAIPVIAGGVAVIILIFIIVLIIVLCCVCRGKKDNKKYNVKKPKKTTGGMWMDEGASGYMPSTMSTNPTYRHTSADTVEEQRGRSLTTEQVTATSFNTLDKNDDRSGSQDKLTDDKYADIDFGTKSSRPYDEQRVEYATVGHTSFTSPQKNAIQTDV